ncbi:MAG: DUF1565 domain-containing protein, partial [Chloroflexota bacterium]
MNKQKRIGRAVPKSVTHKTWQKIAIGTGVLSVLMVLLGVFAFVSFADSESRTMTGGETMALSCDGRGFQIERHSRRNVTIICAGSSNTSPVPTPIPPIEEPPVEDPPVVQPPVEEPVVQGSYYVATNGNDNNNGSQGQPFRTIQNALDSAQPGDTIVVRGGVYNEVVTFETSGTAGNPIRLVAYPGELPVID